jgi:hypothetical protein
MSILARHAGRPRLATREREEVNAALARAQAVVPGLTACYDGTYWIGDAPGGVRALYGEPERLADWLEGVAAGAAATLERGKRE